MEDNKNGDWGLGIGDGDWGLGQSPIPNPQSPSPISKLKCRLYFLNNFEYINLSLFRPYLFMYWGDYIKYQIQTSSSSAVGLRVELVVAID